MFSWPGHLDLAVVHRAHGVEDHCYVQAVARSSQMDTSVYAHGDREPHKVLEVNTIPGADLGSPVARKGARNGETTGRHSVAHLEAAPALDAKVAEEVEEARCLYSLAAGAVVWGNHRSARGKLHGMKWRAVFLEFARALVVEDLSEAVESTSVIVIVSLVVDEIAQGCASYHTFAGLRFVSSVMSSSVSSKTSAFHARNLLSGS